MITRTDDGSSRPLDAGNRGLHYGDGLFETIAMVHGRPQLWTRHLDRLREGCRRLAIATPDPEALRIEAERAAAGVERCVVKIIVTRAGAAHGYRPEPGQSSEHVVLQRPWPDHPREFHHAGVGVRWCRTRLARQPLLAGIKHLNRIEQVLARAEWRDEYAEGLMRDTDGYVIEGTMSNLFLVQEGTLLTPDLAQSGVAGVMRAEVLEQARRLGIPNAQRPVSVDMVEQADELFLTNSLIGIWPVARLEARHYAVVGKITQALQAAIHPRDPLA